MTNQTASYSIEDATAKVAELRVRLEESRTANGIRRGFRWSEGLSVDVVEAHKELVAQLAEAERELFVAANDLLPVPGEDD